ncbi:MAG: sporulation protein [Acinetobacter sp.]
MFNKLMSGLGMQGIQVNTCIYTATPQAGQVINGDVIFKGASSNKNINGIFLKLMTTAEVETDDSEYNTALTIAQWHISGAFELQANQSHSLPFSIQLPFETPITQVPCHVNKTRVWLHTHLDVDWGIDATDKDYLQILPTPTMQAFIQAMQQCGFHLATVDVEKGQLRGHGFHSTIGCYQELEFKPTTFFNGINEIEVSFVAEQHQTHVLLEVDRKFRGDGFKSLTIPHQHTNPATLVNEIRRILGM